MGYPAIENSVSMNKNLHKSRKKSRWSAELTMKACNSFQYFQLRTVLRRTVTKAFFFFSVSCLGKNADSIPVTNAALINGSLPQMQKKPELVSRARFLCYNYIML